MALGGQNGIMGLLIVFGEEELMRIKTEDSTFLTTRMFFFSNNFDG